MNTMIAQIALAGLEAELARIEPEPFEPFDGARSRRIDKLQILFEILTDEMARRRAYEIAA